VTGFLGAADLPDFTFIQAAGQRLGFVDLSGGATAGSTGMDRILLPGGWAGNNSGIYGQANPMKFSGADEIMEYA
jgi:hypothetical protein